ncbi:unnamed protein product, partial [Prorocentrum cordatum]
GGEVDVQDELTGDTQLRLTTARRSLHQEGATRWLFDFSDVLLLPEIDEVVYSFVSDGAADFVRHLARRPSGRIGDRGHRDGGAHERDGHRPGDAGQARRGRAEGPPRGVSRGVGGGAPRARRARAPRRGVRRPARREGRGRRRRRRRRRVFVSSSLCGIGAAVPAGSPSSPRGPLRRAQPVARAAEGVSACFSPSWPR